MPTLLTDSPTIDAPAAETGGAAGYSHLPDAAAIAMKRKIKFEGRPVWAEISLADILHNLKVIRGHVGARRKILAVVKANAYGLGSVPISKALARAGRNGWALRARVRGLSCARLAFASGSWCLRDFGLAKRKFYC